MRARLERLVGYLRIGGLGAAVPLLRSMISDGYHVATIRRRDVRHPFSIRVRTSDYSCFRQVFVLQEYALDARWQPKTIVDAGANIGLASIYFANAFPSSRIVAVEPERGNFRLLQKNCAHAVIPRSHEIVSWLEQAWRSIFVGLFNDQQGCMSCGNTISRLR